MLRFKSASPLWGPQLLSTQISLILSTELGKGSPVGLTAEPEKWGLRACRDSLREVVPGERGGRERGKARRQRHC